MTTSFQNFWKNEKLKFDFSIKFLTSLSCFNVYFSELPLSDINIFFISLKKIEHRDYDLFRIHWCTTMCVVNFETQDQLQCN